MVWSRLSKVYIGCGIRAKLSQLQHAASKTSPVDPNPPTVHATPRPVLYFLLACSIFLSAHGTCHVVKHIELGDGVNLRGAPTERWAEQGHLEETGVGGVNLRVVPTSRKAAHRSGHGVWHMEGGSGVSIMGASRQRKAELGIVRHMEEASGVSIMGAPSQRKAAQGIVSHMEEASRVNTRGAPHRR